MITTLGRFVKMLFNTRMPRTRSTPQMNLRITVSGLHRSAAVRKRNTLTPRSERSMSNEKDSDYDEQSKYIDEEDATKGLQPPPTIFGNRRVSSRRSVRSQRSQQDSSFRYASVRSLFIDFCNRTSSHGVPFFGSASFFGRFVWMAIFLIALIMFLLQTYMTMSEYLDYRTIIEMQLRFEPAPFPAATVCNLNAFKHSEVLSFPELANTIAVWEHALVEKGGLSLSSELKVMNGSKRVRRQAEFQPVFVRCTCNNPNDRCVPNRNPLELNALVCLCFEDVTAGYIWPCYPTTEWTVKTCRQCSFSNTCVDPDRPNATMPYTHNVSCLCQGISNNCVIHPKDEIRWWNPNNYTIYPVEKPTTPPVINANINFEGVYDKGTMTTRTKETLIFMVAELPKESRMNLSYTLQEFVLRCTFNGKDCDLEQDFQLHVDPEYGNCYTFNFNDSVTLKNSRAGPMYGLRLLLDVHQSDYLPTTEAAGVRLVVHEQDQEPFPDTFGYSAPTGFVSSFGLKTKFLQRLDAPYGQCSDTFRPDPYIYKEHYSPEGCYRNCFQLLVLQDCGCGDPRLPLPYETDKPCNVRNDTQLKCLRSITEVVGGFHHLQSDCKCVQPCTENVFETAYSAAAWPSMNFHLGEDCPAVAHIFNDTESCTEYYRQNTAYLEIYYEQLNFENLKETAGYTLVNLFSDFGGNIGLWIGFSVITMAEIIELIFELFYYTIYIKPRRMLKEKRKRKEHSRHGLTLPQLLTKHMRPRHPHPDTDPEADALDKNSSRHTFESNLSQDVSLSSCEKG